jgi:hypothetical protein
MQDNRPAQGRSSSEEPSSSSTTRNGSSIEDDAMKDRRDSSERQRSKWDDLAVKMMEASATTGVSLCLLALVGFSYTKYYNGEVLRSIESAFETGEPVLELAGSTLDPRYRIQPDRWIPRVEQAQIDRIVRGEDRESYHLIMGEKGTGKGSMLIDAMAKIEADGVVMMEAHANPEIFRIRLGHCINFEFHEDNIGALFSIRGPRDASAILDIERAFKKLEQVAITRRAKVGKPLVLIINSAHLIRDNEAGQNLFDVLQQWAEKWAVMGVAVMVISSDKYWVYERLKQKAARMEVTYIHDLSKDRAMQALRNYRRLYFAENTPSSVLEEIYDKVGGRLTFLNRVVKSVDMLAKCDQICFEEKIMFLNHCAIHGEEMDDDVMDQQKYAVSTCTRNIGSNARLMTYEVCSHGSGKMFTSGRFRHGRNLRSTKWPHITATSTPSCSVSYDSIGFHNEAPRYWYLLNR